MSFLRSCFRTFHAFPFPSGDCSRIAQVRAILDAVKLSTRVMGDDRVISCMNAVKSVECVLKKAQNNWENPWKNRKIP